MESWIVWVILGLIAFFLVVLYNRIVALVQRRKNAFSDIDVQLKLRHDLVPEADADQRHMPGIGGADELLERRDEGMILVDAMARAGQKPALGRVDIRRELHPFNVIAGEIEAPPGKEPLEHGVIVAQIAAKFLGRLAAFENADTHGDWPVGCSP